MSRLNGSLAFLAAAGLFLAGSSIVTFVGTRGFWANCLTAMAGVAAVSSTESLADQIVNEEIKSFSVLENQLLRFLFKNWKSVFDVEEAFFPCSCLFNIESVELMLINPEDVVKHIIHSVNLDCVSKTSES